MKIFLCGVIALTALTSSPMKAYAEGDSYNKEALQKHYNVLLKKYYRDVKSSEELAGKVMSVDFFNMAVKHFRRNEFELAEKAIREAISADKKNFYAYEVLGDILYFQHDLESAEEAYKNAFKLGGSSGLREKIEKLSREMEVDKGMKTYKEEHFLIKYRGDQARYQGFDIKTMLKDIRKKIGNDLSHYPTHKTAVLFYDTSEFRKVSQVEHWVGGLYDGKVRLPAYDKSFDRKTLEAIMTHEVAHLFVSDLSLRRAPAWLQEGFAQYEENFVKPVEMKAWKKWVAAKQYYSFPELFSNNSILKEKDPMKVTLFYQQSFSVVKYLIDRYGVFYLKNLMKAYRDGLSDGEAISMVYKISVSKLEKEWEVTL